MPLLFVYVKGLTVDFEKFQVLACFGKSGEQVRQQRFPFFPSSQFLAGGLPGLSVDGKNEPQALSNVLQRASGVSDVLLCLLCCSSNEQERTSSKEGARLLGTSRPESYAGKLFR